MLFEVLFFADDVVLALFDKKVVFDVSNNVTKLKAVGAGIAYFLFVFIVYFLLGFALRDSWDKLMERCNPRP